LAGEKKPPFRSAYEALAVSAVVIRLRQFFFGPRPALVTREHSASLLV
jgi:hypothetical protein